MQCGYLDERSGAYFGLPRFKSGLVTFILSFAAA
jgi:hypothetical protein